MLRRQYAFRALFLVYLLLSLQASAQESAGIDVSESVLTQHNDNARSGGYFSETILKPSNVNEQSFGYLYTLSGIGNDHIGPVVAQPLFAKGVVIGGKTKDVLYVASRTNKIYAFDVSSPGSRSPLWHIELPKVPQILDLDPITAVWRESDVNKHLDLFATGKGGAVLSNSWDMGDQDWHNWFAIRPDTGKAKSGTPQEITAVWGDPIHPQQLNLFMTDERGTVKSIFCSFQLNHPCWRDEAWFSIGTAGIATPGQSVTAILNKDKTHLDLFVAGRDGQVLSNFFENGKWHDWFPIRPDTGTTRPGTPQQITAVWGDPNNPQHLNLFMTDHNGTVKSTFCTPQPNVPCWRAGRPGEGWFTVGQENGKEKMVTPGQPITALWRRDDSTEFSHLDLFAAGKQVTGNYREFTTTVITPIPGQDLVERPGTVLSNYWGKFEGPDRDWGTWFPVPLRAEAIPGMDDSDNPCHQTHGLVGIVSTPVIDAASNTMFVVYRTGLPLDLELGHHQLTFDPELEHHPDAQHWLAAIDIRNGHLMRPPVKILSPPIFSPKGIIRPTFVPSMQLNRPALLLDAGTVYVAFASSRCDYGGNPFPPPPTDSDYSQAHGWVFAYDSRTLDQEGVFTTANGVSDKANHDIIAGIGQRIGERFARECLRIHGKQQCYKWQYRSRSS